MSGHRWNGCVSVCVCVCVCVRGICVCVCVEGGGRSTKHWPVEKRESSCVLPSQ